MHDTVVMFAELADVFNQQHEIKLIVLVAEATIFDRKNERSGLWIAEEKEEWRSGKLKLHIYMLIF